LLHGRTVRHLGTETVTVCLYADSICKLAAFRLAGMPFIWVEIHRI